MSSPNKSCYCYLDSLPTTLLKACLHTLLYPIINIINASLCPGLCHDDFKQVQVNPLLMKSTLPKENLHSVRSISNNLYFQDARKSCRKPSKVSESNCMNNVLKSAYKHFHSTQTAVLKVHNDVTILKIIALILLVNIMWHIWHSPGLVFSILS